MEEIMNEEMLLTQEGYDKIVAEHEELVSVKRAEVAARIKEAISYGDISENAEYDSAKNEQAELEEKIHELEEILRKAKIVQDEDVRGDTVNIGLKVTVQDLDTGDIEVYSIGMGLIGKKKNDTVAIEVPDGVINYKIMNIEK